MFVIAFPCAESLIYRREELNSVRAALDAAAIAKRTLEAQAASQAETCARLSKANEALSTRALTLADEAEQEKRVLQKRLQDEIEEFKRRVEEAQEDVDEQRTRGQAQRIQLLDEVSSTWDSRFGVDIRIA